MNKIAIVGMLFFVISIGTGTAQDLPESATHFSLGGNVHRFQDDFGFSLSATMPYWKGGRGAFRIHLDYSYFEGIAEGEQTYSWMPYLSLRAGAVAVGGTIANAIRLYGEGGVIVVFSNSDLTEDTSVGGYGLFGFEFFMGEMAPVSYFIEVGGMGTGARAGKLGGEPIHANGFMTSAGVRWYM